MEWFSKEFLVEGKESFKDMKNVKLNNIIFNGGVVFNFTESEDLDVIDEDVLYKYNEINIFINIEKYVKKELVLFDDFVRMSKITIQPYGKSNGVDLDTLAMIKHTIEKFMRRANEENTLSLEAVSTMRKICKEDYKFKLEKDGKVYKSLGPVSKDNLPYFLLDDGSENTILLPVSEVASKYKDIVEVEEDKKDK